MNVRRFLVLASLSVILILFAGPTVVYAETPVSAGALTGNATWTAAGSPYVLGGSVSVPAEYTLTVEAGVIVKLPADLSVSGRLLALGTPTQPVTFTSYRDDSQGGDTDDDFGATPPAPGQWSNLMANAGGRIALDHTVVRYGGASHQGVVGNIGGGLDISDSWVEYTHQYGVWINNGAVAIRDSVISGTTSVDATGLGLYVYASGVVAPVITNTEFISNQGAAGYLELRPSGVALDASRISGNTAVGNATNGLRLTATFAGASVLGNAGVPYVIEGSDLTVNESVVLTVEKGTVVKSQTYGVAINGTLQATGQDGEEVVFTSLYDDAYGGDTDGGAILPAADQWSNLTASPSGRIVLDHTIVRFGGASHQGGVGGTGGGLEISDSRVEYTHQYGVWTNNGALSIRDSVISGTTAVGDSGLGLYVAGSGVVAPVISNTQFISNAGKAGYLELGSVALDASRISGNTAGGNGTNGLRLTATFTGASVLANAGIPYVIEASDLTVNAGVVLTVEQGTVVKSQSYGVKVSGTLRATGQDGEEVVFTSLYDDAYGGDTDGSLSTGSPGQWDLLRAISGGQILLDHTIVRFGGFRNMGAVGTSSGDLTLSDSLVELSCGWGFRVKNSDGSLVIAGSVISGTTVCGAGPGDGLDLGGSGVASPVITDTQFINNQGYAGYLNLGAVALDASRISGNSAIGNGGNGLRLGAIFTGTSVLVNAGVPYVNNFSGLTVSAGAVLTVEKGAVVKSLDYGVTVNGTLHAAGQLGEEVVFTSLYDDDDAYGGDTNNDAGATAPAPGQWPTLQANDGGRIALDHTFVRYGGAGGGGVVGSNGGDLEISNSSVEQGCRWGILSQGGALAIRESAISGTTKCGGPGHGLYWEGVLEDISITHTLVMSNAGWGLDLYGAGDGSLLEGNDIVGNAGGGVQLTRSSPGMFRNLITGNPTGVYCVIASQPLIGGAWQDGNDIYGNSVDGVRNDDGETIITATYNWWGSPSGPADAGNPGGSGDALTGMVDYLPWLGFSTRPPTPVLDIAPTVYDFGPVDVYSTSTDYTFTVTNTGSGAWDAGEPAVTGAGAASFHLAGGTCPSLSLVPISTCTSAVHFAPGVPGPVTATLTLPASDPGGLTVTALLRGTGIAKVFLPLVLRGY